MPHKIRVRAYISPDLRARFAEQFPGNGALSWLLETAMTELLAVTDGQPGPKELVRSAIRAAILRERRTQRANAKRPEPTNTDSITLVTTEVLGTDR